MPGPRAELQTVPLPPLVLAMLLRRRDEIVRAARGTVLEVGPWPDEGGFDEVAYVRDVVRVRSLDRLDTDRRFDTVVSCCALPAYADLPAAARCIADHLDESGRFHFVEPVSVPGVWGAVVGLGTSLAGAAGLHLDRDVPSALRNNGLIVAEIERFKMPTMFGSLRHWVSGSALPERPTDRPGALEDEPVGGRP